MDGMACHTGVTGGALGGHSPVSSGGADWGRLYDVPPLDRRAAELLLFTIPVPMAGGALLASGATVLGALVLGAGLVIACLGGVRGWRTRPR